jgi:heme exporter protein D
VSAYLDMGGYAFFVWPSYGLALATLVVLALVSWRARARAQAELAAEEGDDK